MITEEFIRACSEMSKQTDRKLTQEDMKVAIACMVEVIAEVVNNGETVRIKDFLIFEPKEQKGRVIKSAINGEMKGQEVTTPNKRVMKIRQATKFKALVEKEI